MTSRKRRGRGEGSVFFDARRNLWVGTVSLGVDPVTGRRRRKSVSGETKRIVLDQLDAARSQTGESTAKAGKLTVSGLLDKWLESSRRQVSQPVNVNRESFVRLHIVPHLGRIRLSKLSPEHIEAFYATLADSHLASATAHDVASMLVGALKHAVRMRFLASNPAAGIRLPAIIRREMLFLTDLQAKHLLAASMNRWLRPLLSLALGSGCRQGEMLALGWEDVSLDAEPATVRIRRSLSWTKKHGFRLKEPKTNAGRRIIILPAFAVEALRLHRQHAESLERLHLSVFCSSRGGHRHRSDIRKALQSVLAIANTNDVVIPPGLRFHDLRHTHASLLLSGGMSINAVAARLGHANAATTLKWYGHCMPGDDARLAAHIGSILS